MRVEGYFLIEGERERGGGSEGEQHQDPSIYDEKVEEIQHEEYNDSTIL